MGDIHSISLILTGRPGSPLVWAGEVRWGKVKQGRRGRRGGCQHHLAVAFAPVQAHDDIIDGDVCP